MFLWGKGGEGEGGKFFLVAINKLLIIGEIWPPCKTGVIYKGIKVLNLKGCFLPVPVHSL